MADNLGNNIKGNISFQLANHESIAQIVNVGVFNDRQVKVAVEIVSDIADQKWPAGFGNKNFSGAVGFWSIIFDIMFYCFLSGWIQGNHSLGVGLISADNNGVFGNIVKL